VGRAYNPARVIKSSGVHTFYIGRPEDPISQVFETYCIHTEQTFSESCRDMIVIASVYLGMLEDPGIEEGIFLNVGEGVLTPKFYEFRKQAERSRKMQLRRLESNKQLKEELRAVKETAFD